MPAAVERYNAAVEFVDRRLDAGEGDRLAVLTDEQRITYDELAANVNRAGHALRSLGLDMEQRVLLVMHDSPSFAYAFWGAIKIGAVPVPVNTMLTADDYAYLLDDSRAHVLVVSAALLPTMRPALTGRPYLRQVVVADGPGEHLDFAALLASQPADLDPAPTTSDDVAFWLYTSGTTGRSRAAVHLQHDMAFCRDTFARHVLEIGPDDRTFSVAKLYFAYGLGNALYFPSAVGASTVLFPGRPTPEAVFHQVAVHQPTLLFAVPTAYAAMLAAAERGSTADLRSVRLCISAGEPLPAGIYHRWRERFGLEIYDGIGSTEVLHMFVSNRRGAVRPGSSGTPVPGYQARVLGEDGVEVTRGETGNLAVRGDSICAGYWNRHAMTKQAIQGEWIRTGDKYHVDQDGYYWYEGRADDMLKVGGIWVSPSEVESVLIEYPAILECAVVGQEDEAGLVKPKAYVVLKSGDPTDTMADDLRRFVRDRIAHYKCPRWIEFVPELPKTATGKIQRYKLRAAGETAPPDPNAGA